MQTANYDRGSEYRSIAWKSGAKTFVYSLGQPVEINKDDKGRAIKGTLYSIVDASHIVAGTNHFRDIIKLRVMTKRGEVIDWWEIERL